MKLDEAHSSLKLVKKGGFSVMIERFPKHYYNFGPFRVDPSRRLLLRDNEVVPLAPKAFEMLLLLVENVGQVLEKRELLENLWPGSIVEEANLTQTIYLLRRALAEGSDGQQYIETMPKRGYRFVAEVEESREESSVSVEPIQNGSLPVPMSSDEVEEADLIQKAIPAPAATVTARPLWRTILTFGGLALLAGLLIWAVHPWLAQKQVPPVAKGTVHSLAVLPFKPLGSEADDNYLGLGMADVLITRLSELNQIVVQPYSAVRKYNDGNIHPIEVGRELKVDAVLEGTLQKQGDRLRVTWRLHDIRDGHTLWSGKFDESFTDIFKVQDSMSEQIAQALALNLSREQRNLIFKRYTENSLAYELYLKGRFWWSKRTITGLKKGIGYFEQAIAQEPDYALAYAGLADCYNILSILEAMPPQEAFLKARSSALKALELDSTLAEAHTSLGWIKWVYEWDWEGAEYEFKHAVELSPTYAVGHDWYGVCLAQRGRFDEALAALRQAEQLDPISLVIQVHIGWVYFYTGKYDLAIERYHRVLEMDPNYAWAHLHLSQAYEQSGKRDEAIAEMLKAQSLSTNPLRYKARLARLYAVTGKRQEAINMLNVLLETQRQQYVSPHSIALIYAGLGDKEKTIEWLRKGQEQRAGRMVRLKFDPRFDIVRNDPRFQQILQAIFKKSKSDGAVTLAESKK